MTVIILVTLVINLSIIIIIVVITISFYTSIFYTIHFKCGVREHWRCRGCVVLVSSQRTAQNSQTTCRKGQTLLETRPKESKGKQKVLANTLVPKRPKPGAHLFSSVGGKRRQLQKTGTTLPPQPVLHHLQIVNMLQNKGKSQGNTCLQSQRTCTWKFLA